MNDPLARLTTALADRYAIIREEPDLGGATTAEAASFAVVGTPSGGFSRRKNTIADHSPVLGK